MVHMNPCFKKERESRKSFERNSNCGKVSFCSPLVTFAPFSFFKSVIRSSAKNIQTDEQLMAEYKQSGNKICLEVLFNRYCELVFGVALKYLHNQDESKDAVVDIFEKVPSDLKRYEIKNFSHWI